MEQIDPRETIQRDSGPWKNRTVKDIRKLNATQKKEISA